MKKRLIGFIVFLFAGLAHGDADALYQQGAALFASNPFQALELFEQAAEEDNVSAMIGAGHCYESGTGTDVDYAKAIEFYEQAAKQNSLKGCEGLARIHGTCPLPKYHDGAKAVQFAAFVVRKYPGDPAAHTLYAQASLRNMEVVQAVKHGELAVMHSSPENRTEYETALVGYRDGMPVPALATIEWIMEAAQKEVLWAKVKLAQVTANPAGSMYNPQLAVKMCNEAIHEGKEILYLTMGDVYLQEQDLEKANHAYEMFETSGHEITSNDIPVQIRLRAAFAWSTDEVYREAGKAHKGYMDTVYTERYREVFDQYGKSFRMSDPLMELQKIPPRLEDAVFLYRIALARGHPEAQAGLDAIESELSAVPQVEIPEIKPQKKSPKKAFEPFMGFPDLE
jgi:TPR repeat protein